MATPTSVPYPREFQAATGNQLSTLDHGILAKKYGSQLVLAGRFPKGIIYKIAPIEIVNFGVCNRCLILVESTQLFKFGAFSDEEDAKIFVDKDMVLVCAPPLDENASFVLADLAWRESSLLETTIIALESLSITASWTSNRAKRATGELFASYMQESSQWWAEAYRVLPSHPQGGWAAYIEGEWAVYAEGGGVDEFNIILARMIQKYARTSACLDHRFIPHADSYRIKGLISIAAIAGTNTDLEVLDEAYISLLAHPKTILGVLRPSYFEPLLASTTAVVADNEKAEWKSIAQRLSHIKSEEFRAWEMQALIAVEENKSTPLSTSQRPRTRR